MVRKETYLRAKRTVDDRALNRRVLERFGRELSRREEPVRIVELGAGVGTMIARLAGWGLLPDRVSYRAVDHDADCIARARELVPAWLESAGYEVDTLESTTDGSSRGEPPDATTLVARRKGEHNGGEGEGESDEGDGEGRSDGRSVDERLEITLEVADAFALEGSTDVVVAAALLDIVDLEVAIPAVADLLGDEGLLYAPITFDGGTTFAPRDRLDDRIERRYHRHMDEVRDGGSSRAGTELLATLPGREWDVLAAGGSNWIVRPVDGEYPGDETVVVSHVLETISDAVDAVPSGTSPADDATAPLSTADRTRWLERRREELADGDLVYVAHNLDVLARVP